MTDRLRKLDAMFAERVLGARVAIYNDYVTGEAQPGFIDNTLVAGIHVTIPRYTRSLDEAWEGAVFLGHEFHVVWFRKIGKPVATVINIRQGPGFGEHNGIVCDHPAEALVLACLRAVGCTEEELA